MENKKFICCYDGWAIIEYKDNLFFLDFEDMEIKLVKQVAAVAITNQSDIELEDNSDVPRYDVSGELDSERVYCYWRFLDEK